jgi:hypothetical protein
MSVYWFSILVPSPGNYAILLYIILFSSNRYTVCKLIAVPNIVRVVKSRRMRWAVYVTRMGEERVVHRLLVGKPEGKRPFGRPRRRWEDNIKMDVQEIGGVVETGWSWLRIVTGGGHL